MKPLKCPFCRLRYTRKNGFVAGKQQYECCNVHCERTYFTAPCDRYRSPYRDTAAYMRAYRKGLKVWHRSQKSTWETRPELFASIDAEFHFTLDACAQPHNTKCARFYSPEDDGLSQPWSGIVWCNPPYGRGVDAWIAKAHASAQAGATVVCLVKSTTDTKWWHQYTPAAEVRFLPGRERFVGAKHGAPFPVCLVIFRPPLRESVGERLQSSC